MRRTCREGKGCRRDNQRGVMEGGVDVWTDGRRRLWLRVSRSVLGLQCSLALVREAWHTSDHEKYSKRM
jgi:hypothetical protein